MSRELIFSVTKKDFEIQVFRAGGKGGQNANKVSAGVRIIHKESGARGESRQFRDQPMNKKAAFTRLVESSKFQAWLKRKTAEALLGKQELERRVDMAMQDENLLLEFFTGEAQK